MKWATADLPDRGRALIDIRYFDSTRSPYSVAARELTLRAARVEDVRATRSLLDAFKTRGA
jgi:hypothetical protein